MAHLTPEGEVAGGVENPPVLGGQGKLGICPQHQLPGRSWAAQGEGGQAGDGLPVREAQLLVDLGMGIDPLYVPGARRVYVHVDAAEVKAQHVDAAARRLQHPLVPPAGQAAGHPAAAVVLDLEHGQVRDVDAHGGELGCDKPLHRPGDPRRRQIPGDGDAVPREVKGRFGGGETAQDGLRRVDLQWRSRGRGSGLPPRDRQIPGTPAARLLQSTAYPYFSSWDMTASSPLDQRVPGVRTSAFTEATLFRHTG